MFPPGPRWLQGYLRGPPLRQVLAQHHRRGKRNEAVQVSKLLLVLRQSKVQLVGGGKALDRNRPDNVPEPLLKIGDRLVLRRLDRAFARL